MAIDSRDREHFLCHILQKNRAFLLAHPDLKLSTVQQAKLDDLLVRRKQGEPVAYLIGSKGFWKHDFKVTPDTLIPRPETELIIETTLTLLDMGKPARILDLGTGSGAIAISLTLESPYWQVVATDYSKAALEIAKLNLKNILTKEFASSRVSQRAKRSEDCLSRDTNCAGRIVFLQSNWFEKVTGTFDLIVSNPPYIAENDPHLQQGDLRFEPQSALSSGPTGLEDLQTIISTALQFLKPGGILMVEHGYDQAPAVQSLFQQAGFNKVQTQRDLQGHPRLTMGLFPNTKG